MTIRPPALRRGDTVGIVAPGSPMKAHEIEERITYLENFGLRVLPGEHLFADDGYLAGSDRQRAADLMNMYENQTVRAILPLRGGVGVEGILPYLDFASIARHPKILSGYSDLSILLNAVHRVTGQITFHSLMLLDFWNRTPRYSFEQFFGALSGGLYPGRIENPPHMPLVGRVKGNVTGLLAGGNLTTLAGSLGTPFELDTAGKILFLEEVHEPVSTAYRYLTQLKVSGKLGRCAGIVLGECTDCTDSYGKTYEDLIREVLIPLGKPLMTNLAAGHGTFNAALPIGAYVNLNTEAGALTVLEPVVGT